MGGLAKAAAITTGGQMLSGYFAGKASEEDDPDPLAYWGVDLRSDKAKRKAGEEEKEKSQMYTPPAVPTPYGPGVNALQVAPLMPRQPYDPYAAPVPQDPGLMDVAYTPPGGF